MDRLRQEKHTQACLGETEGLSTFTHKLSLAYFSPEVIVTPRGMKTPDPRHHFHVGQSNWCVDLPENSVKSNCAHKMPGKWSSFHQVSQYVRCCLGDMNP